MRVISERITDRGGGWRLTMQLPRFRDEGFERVNEFYDRIADSARAIAADMCGNLIGELHIVCTEGMVSLYIDLIGYRGRELVFCRRISDNRDPDGNEMPPPAEVRRGLTHGGGWYTDGETYYVYKNSFSPGGAGVRRSEVYRFFSVSRVGKRSEGGS